MLAEQAGAVHLTRLDGPRQARFGRGSGGGFALGLGTGPPPPVTRSSSADPRGLHVTLHPCPRPRPFGALEKLREDARSGALDEFCRRNGIRLLVVFGSAVDPTWPALPRDLDVAVLPEPDGDIIAVVNAFIDLLHLDEIDVMDLRRARPVAREQALVGTEPLFEEEPGLLIGLRDAAVLRRMDTDWLRDLSLELMISR